MLSTLKVFPAASLLMLLGACGGTGNPDAGPSGALLLPTTFTSEGRLLNTCSLDPRCSGVPTAPFFASTSMAPAEGAVLAGLVRLEVSGNDMANVELLPATGYTPQLGVFNLSGDKTRAWMDLDTTVLPNGPLNVRISAFNVPAGQAGATEIVAMPARTWNISNTAAPPASFVATLTAAPADGAIVSGTTRLEIRGSAIANAELLPASGYAPRLGVFNVSADKTLAWLDFDTRSLPDGVRDVRVSAFNVTDGQPNAREIVAMSARRWDFRNGSASFTASVTMAPVHGDIVSGATRLEVRGSDIMNVELLPANGYAPRLGVFTVSGDRKFAWLDFDTSALPNGVLEARISAFNVAAGQPNAKEIVAMPARQWNLRH
ncbi:hypothetical protein [Noviherbaspirillum autotrophicum]|uniref:Lipoprotein n=1 Tax=Noviherbaspirillum autotrophicum TaxID=709839 RepID=A0A0C1YGT9_9BURK|nr:hypothetical protein [Noviherbaspirillum autotrophicum]KIF79787.1 hypothetical protein TSA66_01360 [Noviherbaspirillum autotrophicum]